tara:strand:- start:1158 stop:1676 length:519 start_codon:yes stop_codon:yes gene_type:complete
MLNKLKISIFSALILFVLTSCGGFQRSGMDQPVNADDRVKKNLEEGKGLRLNLGNNNKGGNFQFASSNPLWRATLEKLDFIPLANVDYAGGVIITDWYGDIGSDEEIKVAVRFLTNEIRSDALDITIYKKKCTSINKCRTSKIENNTNNEIKASILKRAAILEKEAKSKKKD